MTLESAIYIAYREVEKDSDNWRPEIDCEPVDVALIAAIAGGSALGIIIIAVISTFVGIAIRDRMAWKRWEKQRIEAEKQFGEQQNKLYEEMEMFEVPKLMNDS